MVGEDWTASTECLVLPKMEAFRGRVSYDHQTDIKNPREPSLNLTFSHPENGWLEE